MGNARHHALHQAGVAGILQGPKAQGIEQGQGPGPHGENVAQDAAHPRGRPLEGFHGGGMVMAFDLEGQLIALPQVHHTGVFPRPHQHPRPFGGELAQQRP